MTDNNSADGRSVDRRTFVKGAAATGVAAAGLGSMGSAAAQPNIKNLNVQINDQDGLVNISNLNVLQNVNVSEVDVTVIGGDVTVNVEDNLNDLNIDFDDVQVVEVNDVLTDNNVLNNSVVQVAVGVLSDAGDLVAAGSDAANL